MHHLWFALLALAAGPGFAQENIKLSANDISVRTSLSFKVNDVVARGLLPAGWDLNPPTNGPSKGFNLNFLLIDRLIVQDAEGKSLRADGTVVLSMPAKNTATGRTAVMEVGGFTNPSEAPGPYGVWGAANVTIDRSSHTERDGKSLIKEFWQATSDDGTAISIQLEFLRGALMRSKVEPRVYSAIKPEFYRIYRQEQVTDEVRSVPNGVDHTVSISFKAIGPKLTPLFDGNEQLIAITSIPSHMRSIYLPVQ
jgi:hypothetical protein